MRNIRCRPSCWRSFRIAFSGITLSAFGPASILAGIQKFQPDSLPSSLLFCVAKYHFMPDPTWVLGRLRLKVLLKVNADLRNYWKLLAAMMPLVLLATVMAVSPSAIAQERQNAPVSQTSPPAQAPAEGQPPPCTLTNPCPPSIVSDDTKTLPTANPPTEVAPKKAMRPAPQNLPKVVELTDFQQMVLASLGKSLPIYGLSLFETVPTTFAPVDRVPVTADYVIGPGDELLIRAWGQIDLDVHARVDRNGSIFVPKVGNLNVAGLKYAQVEEFLKSHIGRIYQNFDLNVSMGELRSIDVFVVGQARRPGRYTRRFRPAEGDRFGRSGRNSSHHHRFRRIYQPQALLHRNQQPGCWTAWRKPPGRKARRQRQRGLLHHSRPAEHRGAAEGLQRSSEHPARHQDRGYRGHQGRCQHRLRQGPAVYGPDRSPEDRCVCVPGSGFGKTGCRRHQAGKRSRPGAHHLGCRPGDPRRNQGRNH